VIVADIGGVLPWFQHNIPSIADARRRFLAPGGVLIPERDTIWAAVIEAPNEYAYHALPWTEKPFGFDMEAARRVTINTMDKVRVSPSQLITPIERWAVVDYRNVENPEARARIEWIAARPGLAHGFAAGFDRTVAPGICVSNAPDAPAEMTPKRIYGTAFFPWIHPVALEAGDTVAVDLDARPVGEAYVWRWKSRVTAPDGVARANFLQSTFFGAPLSPGALEKRAATYQPRLGEDGRVLRVVLEAMEEGLPLEAIARRVVERFPGRFRNSGEALAFAGEMAVKFA
jgi:protein arginine N-methyltransferase 1